jgi:hypothetical protein
MVLIQKHLEKVMESLDSMSSALDEYLQGKYDSAKSYSAKTREAESEADDIRREIVNLLHHGAFLPIFREDVMKFVTMVDEIAECAQDTCKFIVTQRPQVPNNIREDLLKVAQKCVEILHPLEDSVDNLSNDTSKIRDKIVEIHRAESDLDEIEWDLSSRIFSTDLSLAHKMHLRQFLGVIVAISDIAEDAGETLETLVLKKQM